MNSSVEIKGGAGIFEAALIAVVLDHILAEEKAISTGSNLIDDRLPAWVRALDTRREIVLPPVNTR
ncbi:MAG TPA: hypothetical protein VIW94_07735 [Acidimicrobiia bacterium]